MVVSASYICERKGEEWGVFVRLSVPENFARLSVPEKQRNSVANAPPANREPVALAVIVRWTEVCRVEIQDPRIRSGVERTRPEVAIRRPITERRVSPIVEPASYICEWKGEERGVFVRLPRF